MYVVVLTIAVLNSAITVTLPAGYPTHELCSRAAVAQASALHVQTEGPPTGAGIIVDCRMVI